MKDDGDCESITSPRVVLSYAAFNCLRPLEAHKNLTMRHSAEIFEHAFVV